MADLNDFLSKLGLNNTIPQYTDSPMDLQAPDNAPINQVPAEAADPSDFAPAEEVDNSTPASPNTPLMSQKDIDAIHALPPAPETLKTDPTPMPASVDATSTATDMPTAETKSPELKKADLLQQLLDAQKAATDSNSRIGTASVIGQLGQAIAAARGGKAADITNTLKAIQEQNNAPVEDLKQRIASEPKILEIKRLQQASDPDSDISKYMRQIATMQVLQSAKRNGITDPDELKAQTDQLGKMSALDLEKAGFKGAQAGMTHVPSKEERFIVNGHPVEYDPYTGYRDAVTKKPVSAEDKIQNAIPRTDPVTGLLHYTMINPTEEAKSASAIDQNSKPTLTDLNKENPKIFKDYVLPIQKEFDKDPVIQGSRKAQQAATTLLTKISALDPNNPKVDSGIKEALAAQAASLSIGGGRVPEGVIKEFGGSGGIINKINRYVSEKGEGVMTPEDVAYFKKLGLKFAQANNQALTDASQMYVDKLKQTPGYEGKLDDATASKFLGVAGANKNSMVDQVHSMDAKKTSGKTDSKVDAYAKQNNLSYDQAKNILINRGYKPNE